MKKLMFSAVALVAFSFASMANNEVKEVEVKETKKEVVKRLGKCDLLSADVYDAYIAGGATVEYAHDKSIEAYQNCLNDL